MNQLDLTLVEPPRARRRDPDTSKDAAGKVGTEKLQKVILYYLLQLGATGATCGEIALNVGLPRDSLSPRMRTLEKAGLIVATEERRILSGGRPQIVWKRV
jgi:predicted ArsR family transcriptional regulator